MKQRINSSYDITESLQCGRLRMIDKRTYHGGRHEHFRRYSLKIALGFLELVNRNLFTVSL